MGAGDTPEVLENESPIPTRNGSKTRRAKKAAAKRRTAPADVEVPVDHDNGDSTAVKDRWASR